jgi:hypothetical protein
MCDSLVKKSRSLLHQWLPLILMQSLYFSCISIFGTICSQIQCIHIFTEDAVSATNWNLKFPCNLFNCLAMIREQNLLHLSPIFIVPRYWKLFAVIDLMTFLGHVDLSQMWTGMYFVCHVRKKSAVFVLLIFRVTTKILLAYCWRWPVCLLQNVPLRVFFFGTCDAR